METGCVESMSSGNVVATDVYPPTTAELEALVAELMLKSNRLIGTYPGLLDTAEQRDHAVGFTVEFMTSMACGYCVQHEAHDAVYCMSQIRKAINTLINDAARPVPSGMTHLSHGAFDLLRAAARVPDADLPRVMASPAHLRDACTKGVAALRCMMTDLATYYMDVEAAHVNDTVGPLVQALLGDNVPKLMCRALSMHFLTLVFDCTRLASGARLANRAFGDDLAPLTDDVRRCELARADAFMAMRLYTGLELVIAMMMMGVAKRSEREQGRDKWNLTLPGRAVLAFRASVGETLKAYDTSKREPAQRAGKTYTAQTPGYVAALQEQAAMLAAHINEPDSPLYDALVAGLSEAQLFSMPTHNLRWVGHSAKYTFWGAVGTTTEVHCSKFPHGDDKRVPSFESAMAMTAAMVMTSVVEGKCEPLVQVSGSMRAAMQEASKSWPPVSSFYGRDYAETERKITAKAAREGRDPEGREVGESFGYRLEWMGYLANGAPPRPVSRNGSDDHKRMKAAIVTLARVESLACGGAPRAALPIPSGNAIHHVHGAAHAAEPSATCLSGHLRSVFHEVGDARYRELAIQQRDDPLVRKQLFVERVLERTAPMFKAWSGGVLVSEPYYDFFAEVWKRFNASLRHPSSAWGGKIARWLDHYNAGTTPPRANGEAKLIHPWRAQHLQQSVARAPLDERYGEAKVLQLPTPHERAAARLYRGLLGGVVEAYDYAPWASHLVRRFCTMEEHRVAAKRKREEDDRAILSLVTSVRRQTQPAGKRTVVSQLSPSLARQRGPVGGQA